MRQTAYEMRISDWSSDVCSSDPMNTGQICTAATRLFLEDTIHDEFVGKLKDFTGKLKVGSGLDEGVMIGPLVSDEQLERVSGYLDIGKEEGATRKIGMLGTKVY